MTDFRTRSVIRWPVATPQRAPTTANELSDAAKTAFCGTGS